MTGKRFIQRIKRYNLNLHTRNNRLISKTICY
ncbi:MAG: IS1 family transposase [Yersinia sp. (in: enterobacteria)]